MNKAKELIENNTLTNIVVESEGVVYKEIAMTAIAIAKEEEKQRWEKATKAFCKEERRFVIEKALEAFLECESYDDFEILMNECN